MRSFRLDGATAFTPPGDATMASSAIHGVGARSNVPDPRRNPAPVETPRPPLPRDTRNLRPVQSTVRPLNNEIGWSDPGTSTGYSWGVGDGGAPEGAPANLHVDVHAHQGFDPVWGTESDHAGVGPKDYGNWNSMSGGFTDAQAHEQHNGSGNVDPRRENGGYAFIRPQYQPLPEELTKEVAEPAHVPVPNEIYQRPAWQFHQGRPATMPKFLYERPFDQMISQHPAGGKVLPTSPPSVGGSDTDATPRASMPYMDSGATAQRVDGYNGPSLGARGMDPVSPGSSRNTWRLQPEKWDEYLVDTSGTVQ